MEANKQYNAVIDKIAKSRKVGISQASLAKSLNIDPKTLFYLMKRLFAMKLL
jgi:DNA-binding CsgD family transcriptional regulator